MIVDEKLKVIWLHNPKCGGMFFRQVYVDSKKNGLGSIFLGDYNENNNTDLAHIDYGSLARFIPNYKDYRITVFIRNPYNRFVSGWKMACSKNPDIKNIYEKCGNNIQNVCDYLSNLNYYQQDALLRNRRVPWLSPQSNYVRNNTIIMKYESLEDWQLLCNIFQIQLTDVNIKGDYDLNADTKNMIRSLYYDDELIFNAYNL